MDALLRLPVLTPVVLDVAYALAAVVLVLLLARRTHRWPVLAVTGIVVGAVVGVVVLLLVEGVADVFGPPLGWSTRAWVVACFAALGLVVMNWQHATVRRRIGATLGAVVIVATSVLGVNALYGLNPTVGSIFGISTIDPLPLPDPIASTAATAATGPLWQTWTPPADMPTTGTTGSVVIPPTVSGFPARPAGIYLPPAALTADPPRLPLVVMLMGQPGNPDPGPIAGVLNTYAAAHQGLAPIVVVADQLADPSKDTLCLDTPHFGKVDTYVNQDVLTWARANLNVLPDRASTTIAGYSHGGQCAISFAAKHPDLWGNVLDVSGEEFPGSDHAAEVLKSVFKGDQAAYDAQKPAVILAQHQYPDTVAIFTAAKDDPSYLPAAQTLSAAAKAAGMQVTYVELPSGGHGIGALNGGLDAGFAVLYPRLGLSGP